MGPRFAALRASQPHNPTLGFGLSVQDRICTKSPIDTTTAATPLSPGGQGKPAAFPFGLWRHRNMRGRNGYLTSRRTPGFNETRLGTSITLNYHLMFYCVPSSHFFPPRSAATSHPLTAPSPCPI
jgi:hypothetical protein